MSVKTINLTQQLHQYLLDVSLREPPILKKLRQETQDLTGAQMQISPEQGQFMQLLIELLSAKKTLDIGTFTGYSSLAVALALPKDGKVVTCDISSECTMMAKKYWQEAGVTEKIDLRVAPALETLEQLIATGEKESFDFSFIDADKTNYIHYYERSLTLLRAGGLIAIDNVLWSGRVADETNQDKTTKNLRKFNEKLLHDERITLSMLSLGDGLTLARKRS